MPESDGSKLFKRVNDDDVVHVWYQHTPVGAETGKYPRVPALRNAQNVPNAPNALSAT